ncbi:siderophore-interacting protein [Nocardiopsis ganjiahuensis]|uniref:siderophore-interacting protein n=1 Tax=Nocardiopsis ganjiahuensis TaxID=239984 RepID=UPI00035D198A
MVRAHVVRVAPLSAHFVTVTVGGPELAGFDFLGLDQCTRVFLPREGQSALRMPTAAHNGWIAQYYLMPLSERPHMRNYTVRRFDRGRLEMDIEFVSHGDTGPASAWAGRTEPGDEVGLYAEGCSYLPSPGTEWQLLVGDESALPAVMSILEEAPPELRAEVFLEVPGEEDRRRPVVPDGVNVHWLPREDPGALPGALALETVRERLAAGTLPEGRPYCFLAGEKALPTGLRRTLVKEHGVNRADVTFVGYWRHGAAAMK